MSHLLQAIENSAQPWSERLLQASWQGALVIVVAWAIGRWCTFLSPRVICWVWRLACLKLIVAVLWIDPIALPLLPAPAGARVAGATIPPAPVSSATVTVPSARAAIQEIDPRPLIDRIEAQTLSSTGPTDWGTQLFPLVVRLLQSLWLMGV